MCGIVGIIKKSGEISVMEVDAVKSALDIQHHRGPDAQSIWQDSKVVLGHNRLSIIDLSSAANQPFHREDLNLVVVFNGEIYNYKKIREELLSLGAEFRTNSDTEILLVGYHIFGPNFLEKLVGMFAFVIYNTLTKQIFMARDRFGEKPILFIEDDSSLYFASELATLREIYPYELTINQDAVVDLMEQMYISSHHTIYQQVRVFPQATHCQVEGMKVSWKKYYQYPRLASSSPPFSVLKSEVKHLLQSIVEDQLHADVPVATFLSSGIDSSIITAMAKEIKPDILAITMSSGDSESDEVEQASQFAKKLQINHEIVSINPSSIQVLAKLLKHVQPLADASLIPTHLVTNQISSHTKVMLSGDAGDEVFGSYRKPAQFLENRSLFPKIGFELMNSAYQVMPEFSYKFFSDKNRFKWAGWEGFYFKTNLSGNFSKIFKRSKSQNTVLKKAQELMESYSSNIEKLSFGVDVETRLPSDFLFKVDTASMASSLEVRAPFLDHRLVDISFKSSLDSLMPSRVDKELTRFIYKEFAGYEHQGSKKGFSFPYAEYLKNEWGMYLEQFLKEGLSEEFFDFNPSEILSILQQHRTQPQQKWGRILYSVLVLEVWLRVFHLKQEITIS